jgi:hypothetical protein
LKRCKSEEGEREKHTGQNKDGKKKVGALKQEKEW